MPGGDSISSQFGGGNQSFTTPQVALAKKNLLQFGSVPDLLCAIWLSGCCGGAILGGCVPNILKLIFLFVCGGVGPVLRLRIVRLCVRVPAFRDVEN